MINDKGNKLIVARNRDTQAITWAITKDIISNGERSATPEQIKTIKQAGCVHHFKLYDDDGILYYEGYSADCDSYAAFNPLDWAMNDSGCTSIKYRNADGTYSYL